MNININNTVHKHEQYSTQTQKVKYINNTVHKQNININNTVHKHK